MLDIVEELVDVHNVTNVLEGYPQFTFNKAIIQNIPMYHLNFDRRDNWSNEFIRLFI